MAFSDCRESLAQLLIASCSYSNCRRIEYLTVFSHCTDNEIEEEAYCIGQHIGWALSSKLGNEFRNKIFVLEELLKNEKWFMDTTEIF